MKLWISTSSVQLIPSSPSVLTLFHVPKSLPFQGLPFVEGVAVFVPHQVNKKVPDHVKKLLFSIKPIGWDYAPEGLTHHQLPYNARLGVVELPP